MLTWQDSSRPRNLILALEAACLAVEGLSQELHDVAALDAGVVEALDPLDQRAAVAGCLLKRKAEAEAQHELLLLVCVPACR